MAPAEEEIVSLKRSAEYCGTIHVVWAADAPSWLSPRNGQFWRGASESTLCTRGLSLCAVSNRERRTSNASRA